MKLSLLLKSTLMASIGLVATGFADSPATQPATDSATDSIAFVEPSQSGTTRIGGAARGVATTDEIYLLVCSHPGRTINPRPTIYWYLTSDTEADIDLVISEPRQSTPFYKTRLHGKTKRGLQEFSLSDATADLKLNVRYKLTAMVWENADDPTNNPFSSGYIQRVSPPTGLTLTAAGYGQANLWYDMLDSLTQNIHQEPADSHLRNQRLNLLRQQHIFLGFAPPDAVTPEIASVVAQSAVDAKAHEKQLLNQFANDDQQEVQHIR